MNNNKVQDFLPIVLIRGAGEQASGVGWTLAKAGFRVIMTEIPQPLMVRWPVCFGTAVAEGTWEVEGIQGRLVNSPLQCQQVWKEGKIAVLVDPQGIYIREIKPEILVDAILAKQNLGTHSNMAPLTIALGPGFVAGADADIVVETNRGHNLGRLIYSGTAEANTGIPGDIAGFTRQRVIYSPAAGIFTACRQIGEQVVEGEIIGEVSVGGELIPIPATLTGVLRGVLRSATPIGEKVKIGDIDPRNYRDYCWTISDKARTLGTAVLFAILAEQSELVWLTPNIGASVGDSTPTEEN